MAFQTITAIKERFKLDKRRANQVDDTFKRNLVMRKLLDIRQQYLKPGTIITFEVRPSESDAMNDIVQSGKLNKTLGFRQLDAYTFEMWNINMDIFGSQDK